MQLKYLEERRDEIRGIFQEVSSVEICSGLLMELKSQLVRVKALMGWVSVTRGDGAAKESRRSAVTKTALVGNSAKIHLLFAKVKLLTNEIDRQGGWQAALYLDDDGGMNMDINIDVWPVETQVLILKDMSAKLSADVDLAEADNIERHEREESQRANRERTERAYEKLKHEMSALKQFKAVEAADRLGGNKTGNKLYHVLGDTPPASVSKEELEKAKRRCEALGGTLHRHRLAEAQLHLSLSHLFENARDIFERQFGAKHDAIESLGADNLQTGLISDLVDGAERLVQKYNHELGNGGRFAIVICLRVYVLLRYVHSPVRLRNSRE